MTDRMRKDNPQDDPGLPPRLVEDLTELYKPPAGVPREVDDEILFAAKEQLGNTRRAWQWGLVGVIAATIALVFGIELIMQPRRPAPRTEPYVRSPAPAIMCEDIDLSGRVDILDAFLLARRIETGSGTRPEWDVNKDGRINKADVDAVALTAVRLNGGAS
jgi:hypothetical protein